MGPLMASFNYFACTKNFTAIYLFKVHKSFTVCNPCSPLQEFMMMSEKFLRNI